MNVNPTGNENVGKLSIEPLDTTQGKHRNMREREGERERDSNEFNMRFMFDILQRAV